MNSRVIFFLLKNMMQVAAVLVVVVFMVTDCDGYGIGATCTGDNDCIGTNPHSHCYKWLTPESCPSGVCRCDENYSGNTCIRSPFIKGHGEICNSTWKCDKELHCDDMTGRCVCATSTYIFKQTINTCQADHARVVNESCHTTSECYNFRGAEGGIECVGYPGKSCQCKPGYHATVGICYKPHYGQSCNTEVGCTMMSHPDYSILTNDDPSRATEMCDGTTCVCPQDSELVPLSVYGTLLFQCLRKATTPLKAPGNTCQTSSECESKMCITCPGSRTTSRKCVRLSDHAERAIHSVNKVLTIAVGAMSIFTLWTRA